MSIDDPFLSFADVSISLQVGFSLKQARPGHRSPVKHLFQPPVEALCPVRHLRVDVEATWEKRFARALLVTTIPLFGAGVKISLKHWFAKVFKDAGIADSLTSARAAVSSFLACGIPDNTIMMAADMASACSLYSNYACLIPGGALNHLAASVQAALGAS